MGPPAMQTCKSYSKVGGPHIDRLLPKLKSMSWWLLNVLIVALKCGGFRQVHLLRSVVRSMTE